jgi:hypothetical protein
MMPFWSELITLGIEGLNVYYNKRGRCGERDVNDSIMPTTYATMLGYIDDGMLESNDVVLVAELRGAGRRL